MDELEARLNGLVGNAPPGMQPNTTVTGGVPYQPPQQHHQQPPQQHHHQQPPQQHHQQPPQQQQTPQYPVNLAMPGPGGATVQAMSHQPNPGSGGQLRDGVYYPPQYQQHQPPPPQYTSPPGQQPPPPQYTSPPAQQAQPEQYQPPPQQPQGRPKKPGSKPRKDESEESWRERCAKYPEELRQWEARKAAERGESPPPQQQQLPVQQPPTQQAPSFQHQPPVNTQPTEGFPQLLKRFREDCAKIGVTVNHVSCS